VKRAEERYYTGSVQRQLAAGAVGTPEGAGVSPFRRRITEVGTGASKRTRTRGGETRNASGAAQARRITISDIAERAGVSKGAVSYALNERPGVSEQTRARILAIAEQLGWYPNRAARSLSAARANACGLVLARPPKTLALEPFFMEFIVGVEAALSARSVALAIQLVPDVHEETRVYRRWWGERRVDGTLVVDLRVDDPRIDELTRLGLPAVVVGRPLPGAALPAVWSDETATMTEIVRHLAALGHRRIARVAGLSEFVHTVERTAAFHRATADLGLSGEAVDTDFTPDSGARVTRQLLSAPAPPTAIVYESDLLGVTGLGVAQQMGFSVPGDVSIVAWDDSLVCQVVHPPLTAVSRDISAYGMAAARHLLELIDGRASGDLETPRGELTLRGSTGPVHSGRARTRPRRPGR
jgi:DNA-binding LacI/PurR family transcriptional regulator